MKIRSLLLGAVAGLCITAFGASPADAQIYTAFTNTIQNEPYIPLGPSRVVLPAANFYEGQIPGTQDSDDGYYLDPNRMAYGIRFNDIPGGNGFVFEFDGRRHTDVNINVNGFLTFGEAYFLGSDNPLNLFRKDPPNGVVAPYWGDHYYRTADDIGFVPSQISASIRKEWDEALNDSIRVLVIEWRNLNINYNFDPLNPNDPLSPNRSPQPTSVGTFQVHLYESKGVNDSKRGKQGDIEFHYSTVGHPSVPGVVKTSGAAVGIESYAPPASAGRTTFMNALFIEDPNSPAFQPGVDHPDSVRRSTRLSSTWAPSRANNNVIVFRATPQPGIAGWGDGDANLSQLTKHLGLPQNQFVTPSDVILIMRAVVMGRPLDSLRLRGAYHGDVNHNGRYYYSFLNNPNGVRVNIETRSENEFDDLPNDPTLTDVFYEANEYDAALIMAYMAGKIPTLPWRLDTIVEYGKAGVVGRADNISIPVAVGNGNGSYKLPIYLNGVMNGAVGVKFDVNGTVSAVEVIEKEGNELLAQYNEGRVVIVGKGTFAADELIGYVVVNTNDTDIELNNVRFNDQAKGSMKIQGSSVAAGEATVHSFPNPMTSTMTIEANLPAEGLYTVAVYDMMGNKVATLADGALAAGMNTFTWDGTDAYGNAVGSGMYIYRIEGNGVHLTKQLTVVR